MPAPRGVEHCQCGKVGYRDPDEAHVAAQALRDEERRRNRRRTRPISKYRCRDSGLWHVGHSSPRPAPKKRRQPRLR